MISQNYRSHKQDSRNPTVDYFQYHVNCLPYIYYTYVVLNVFPSNLCLNQIMPCALVLPSTSSAWTCTCTHLCPDNMRQEWLLWSLNERQLHKGQLYDETTVYFQGASTDVLDKASHWLHSVPEIAVPISRSHQCSGWGLVLAETCPSYRVGDLA